MTQARLRRQPALRRAAGRARVRARRRRLGRAGARRRARRFGPRRRGRARRRARRSAALPFVVADLGSLRDDARGVRSEADLYGDAAGRDRQGGRRATPSSAAAGLHGPVPGPGGGLGPAHAQRARSASSPTPPGTSIAAALPPRSRATRASRCVTRDPQWVVRRALPRTSAPLSCGRWRPTSRARRGSCGSRAVATARIAVPARRSPCSSCSRLLLRNARARASATGSTRACRSGSPTGR